MSGPADDVLHCPAGVACGQARPMPPTPALDIAGLTVRYGETVAVDGLDLRIEAGETVALLGPNGAGKSSTVNAALGLFRPAAGRVLVTGRTPAEAVRAGSVGAMLQHGGLPSETRVGEVLTLVRRRYDQPWPVEDLAATTGVGGVLGRGSPGSPGASPSGCCSLSRWPGRRHCCCSTSRPRPWTSRGGRPS